MSKTQTWAKVGKQLKTQFFASNPDATDSAWREMSKKLKVQFDQQYKEKHKGKA